MNNLYRKLFSLLLGLLLTSAVLAETDQEKLKATKMFDSTELINLPQNYAVVEFRLSEDQFPPASRQPILPGTARNSQPENILYLGVWSNSFKQYDPLRAFMSPCRFYMENTNESKTSVTGTSRFKMDLHSPQAAAYGEDNWTLVTNSTVRSLAEKPAVNASRPELIPLPFPYRAVRTGQLSCTARMIASFDSSMVYTLKVTQTGQPLIAEGLLQNETSISISFNLPQGPNTYTLNLKQGVDTSAASSFKQAYKLPDSLKGQKGWMPVPINEKIISSTLKWNPKTTVYTRFQERVPVMFPKQLNHGDVYWLFLSKGSSATLTYSFFPPTGPLAPKALSRGWHLIARDAYGLNEQNIQTLIQNKVIFPIVYFFNIETQKYQQWNNGQPLPDCLFIFKNK